MGWLGNSLLPISLLFSLQNFFFRCQQLHFQIAKTLADMAENQLKPTGGFLSRLKQLQTPAQSPPKSGLTHPILNVKPAKPATN